MRFLILIVFAGLLCACDHPASLPLPEPFSNRGELVVLVAPGPLTYEAVNAPMRKTPSDAENEENSDELAAGLEYDLLQRFAQESGVTVRVIVTSPQQIRNRLLKHEAHLAMNWLTPIPEAKNVVYSPAYLESRSVLVRHESAPSVPKPEQLGSQTITVLEGTQQHHILLELQRRLPGLVIETFSDGTLLDLLEAVAARKAGMALVDQAVLDIGLNFYPMLQAGSEVGAPYPIAWMFPADGDPEVLRRAQAFLDKMRGSVEMSRLHDRYLGHVKRLETGDINAFLSRIKTLLPRYQAIFEEAGRQNDLDWRLLAALSYQESHWNPLNTSPTGVRGMMMLTTETADRLGVKDRLDPRESILGGAHYVSILKNGLPETTLEPDRTWQALAAYNIGPGHFNAARAIARQLKVEGDFWFEMKKILPLLARPHYYSRLRSGRARGGEAVILAENVRIYYDILQHHASYATLEGVREHGSGLKPPRQPQGIPVELEAAENERILAPL